MDRLSELPVSILLHILSYLTMKDVVKTSVLSKHWTHLWTIVQDLDFDPKDFFPNQKFVDFVNRTLLCRGTSKTRRLRIGLFLNASSSNDFEEWILYAVKNNVEELLLDFDQDICYWCPPQCVYRTSSLKTLRLWSCKFFPVVQISWNSLTKLTLRFSVLFDEDVQKIMTGAPKLECLELVWCSGYDHLSFDSPSLRMLIINDQEPVEFEAGPVMKISAPNVQSLSLSGSFYRECVLMNVPSVIHATLDFYVLAGSSREKKKLKWKQDSLMEVFRVLRHVDNLTLGSWCIEVLTLREKRHIPCHISTHKCITLRTHMKEDDLWGIINLLKSSPALETLIIDLQFDPYEQLQEGTELADLGNLCNSNNADYLASQVKHAKCLMHLLKTVKITQFVAKNSIFPFLEFIMKNGRILEDVVIIAKRVEANSPDSLLKVSKRLLGLRRASPQAVVTLVS